MKTTFTRRQFLRRSTLAGASVLILRDSRLAFGAEANSRLNLAAIGVAGQGGSNLDNFAKLPTNIVALCDVDQAHAAGTFKKFPQAKRFQDFRRMLDQVGREVDAVVVSTPDHTHAVAAVAAMKLGKHVYCEKPLARTVHEARVMRETALKQKVVTQMGNQGSASNGLRRAVEFVWQGAIGEVREAHIWFGGGNGPQTRPADRPPVPPTLDWDLWLGPAPQRPYNPCYLPGKWRDWRAFGSGIVGDFGCHTGNLMFQALRLEQLWNFAGGPSPKRLLVRVEAKPSEVNAEGYPTSMVAHVEMPAHGVLPSVKLHLYARVKPPADLLLGYPSGDWGDLLIGSKGRIYSDCPWNTRYVLLPEDQYKDVKGGPPQTIPPSKGHHAEWVDACQGRGQPFSSFAIGGPLTELMQLVNLATLVEGPVEYDTVSGMVTNSPAANELVRRDYRSGWKL